MMMICRIDILRIQDPSSFWIAHKNPMPFINLVNEAIKADLNKQLNNKVQLSPFITNATMPITMSIDSGELLFKHKIRRA
jgi:hypothetical protein